MAEITLYNTATRRKERLDPVVPGKVSMYVCGPTVYDRAHLGNARPAVVFDVLYRLLRQEFGAENVTYVRNITDVEDKIIDRAAERGIGIDDLTATTEAWYHEDMAALGVLPPDESPHATDYIPQMVAMIADLIDKGHAYAAEGHVLFSVSSYDDYGTLSGRSVDDMIAGARVEVAPYKQDPMDFVLWKPSTDDQPGWDSPWGRGRPGWHIECSAMSHAILGQSFDIHGGGIDLQFPHHENEIAQSKCAHPGSDFARIWMHNEMLQVEGKKMSKSLGNFFTVRDLLDQGVPGDVIRFVFLSTHYRKPMDWTERKANEAHRALRAIRDNDEVAGMLQVKNAERLATELPPPSDGIVNALKDDLNSALALTEFRRLAKERPESRDAALQTIADGKLLGFFDGATSVPTVVSTRNFLPGFEHDLHELRLEAMKSKDFRHVDALKSALTDAGIEVQMDKEGVRLKPGPNFNPAKLEVLK